ncbi:MAG TPA: diguanylate cyclase [Myxococcaceae bacterium]
MRALVADPTEPLASKLREALLSAGFEVAVAGSLDAAVDVLREEEPQIVFASSSEMFDGALLCARTRALRPTCPVVMVYFPDAPDPVHDAESTGADAWIQAPFTPSAVGTLAHAMLGVHELRVRLVQLEKEVRAAADKQVSATSEFEVLKKLLLIEVKRSRRYRYPVAFLLVGVDSLEARAGGLSLEKRAQLLALLLRHIASTVRDIDLAVPSSDGRFLVFLSHTPREGARVAASRIVQRVSKLDPKTPLTVSVGLACYQPGPESDRVSFGALMREAADNLKRAQKAGGNRVEGGGGGERPGRRPTRVTTVRAPKSG